MAYETCLADAPPPPMSRRAESAAARALRPAIAWPTVVLAGLLPSLYLMIGAVAVTGNLALWLSILAMGILAYAHYTLVHEAIHGNIFPSRDDLRWLESAIAWFGSLVLLNSYPVLRRTHLGHHMHTNSENDPDIFVKGNFFALIGKWLILSPMVLLPPALIRYFNRNSYEQLRSILTRREWWIANMTSSGLAASLAVACLSAQGLRIALLWFAAARVGALLLNIFFRWLPHHPFEETSRYRNTRISLWPGGEILLLWQNLHLIHHLWPGVPFYQYRRLFREIRPILVAQEARLEGFFPGSTPLCEVKSQPPGD